MSLGLERCPPARPHWQGQRGMAAKVLTADAAGRGPFLGVGGEAAPQRALGAEGSSAAAANPLTLCGALSFSSLERNGSWGDAWGAGGCGPPAFPLSRRN